MATCIAQNWCLTRLRLYSNIASMNEYATTAIWKKTKKVLKANANKRDMTLVTYLHWLAQIDKQEIKEGLRDEKKAEYKGFGELIEAVKSRKMSILGIMRNGAETERYQKGTAADGSNYQNVR